MSEKYLGEVSTPLLIKQIEEIILELDGKKRGYLTNDKLDIQIGMWLKLLTMLKEYDECDKKSKFVFASQC